MNNNFMINHSVTNDTRECAYYTILGDHEELDNDNNPIVSDDNDKALAKKITINGKNKFYIKIGAYGRIYNPIGMFSEGKSNKFLTQSGKKAWDYREVNGKVFDMYLSFLKTKNIAWLNNAQREIN